MSSPSHSTLLLGYFPSTSEKKTCRARNLLKQTWWQTKQFDKRISNWNGRQGKRSGKICRKEILSREENTTVKATTHKNARKFVVFLVCFAIAEAFTNENEISNISTECKALESAEQILCLLTFANVVQVRWSMLTESPNRLRRTFAPTAYTHTRRPYSYTQAHIYTRKHTNTA